ncbi:hypothetical protein TcBrA4_0071430 [Trypanosoma cruzi]|nr:hypothetical protein TcBrA4_0071430 [Trypanosoma cruzi]
MVTGESPKLTNGIYPPHKINAILYDAFLPYVFLERHNFQRSGDRQRQDKFLFSFIQGHSRVGLYEETTLVSNTTSEWSDIRARLPDLSRQHCDNRAQIATMDGNETRNAKLTVADPSTDPLSISGSNDKP